jgi:glycine betaine/proline transport system permease protein
VPPAIKDPGSERLCTRASASGMSVPTASADLVGVNQTTMAVLSVVIIAAIIGGFSGIG